MFIDRAAVISFLDDMMSKTGTSISALATKSGSAASTLNRYYYKRTDTIGLTTLNKVAKSCGYESYEQYLKSNERKRAAELVPVRGEIGAGEAVTMLDSSVVLEEVEPPAGYYADGITALVVHGESMLPQLEEGWLIFYKNPFRGVPDECINKLCVVCLEDEAMVVKAVVKGSKLNHFHLLSKNPTHAPMFDQRVVWAARVIDIRPR